MSSIFEKITYHTHKASIYLKVFLVLISIVLIGSCQQKEEIDWDQEKLFTLLTPNETGITFQNTLTEDEKNNHIINDMIISGAGVAVGDINNDGLPDLYFTGNQVQDRLYLNQGNLQFKEITRKAGIHLSLIHI